jgi:hypothetical protein
MRRGSGAGKKHETPPPSPSKRPKRAVIEDDAVSALRESEGMAANLAKLAKFNERNSRSRSKGHAAAAVASFSQEPALQAPASQAPALQAPATQAAARSIGELQQLANSFKTPTSTAEWAAMHAALLGSEATCAMMQLSRWCEEQFYLGTRAAPTPILL